MPNTEREGKKKGWGWGLSEKALKRPTQREKKKRRGKKEEIYEVPYEIGTSVKKELVE